MPPRKHDAPAADGDEQPPSDAGIVELFVNAYRQGVFPMADIPASRRKSADQIPRSRGVRWFRPDPRAIIPLCDGGLHVPSGVKRALAKRRFVITSDRDFESVIVHCALPGPRRGGAWLDQMLVACYITLHHSGRSHSLEVWLDHDAPPGPTTIASEPPENGVLVGGIYGVSIGRAFMAESMFSDLEHGGADASSAALVTLWNHLRARGYALLDVQMKNDHTARFGVVEITNDEYQRLLGPATNGPDAWGPLVPGSSTHPTT